MAETPHAKAGWYPHPSMANTLRYWDGTSWTDQVAPAGAAPVVSRSGPGVGTITAGILLAVVIVIGAVWLIVALVTSNDDLDCATQNAQRAQDGRPALECR